MKQLSLAAILFFSVVARSPAHVIDDFTDGPIRLTRDGAIVTFTQPSLDVSRVTGGTRHFELGEFGADGQYVDISNGFLSLGLEDPGLAYLRLRYGSDDHPLNLDLRASGHDRFVFENMMEIPTAGWVRVRSPGGAESVESLFELRNRPFLLFNEFSTGVDFSNVSSIELQVVRSSGFEIGTIRTVPEPNCFVLLLAVFPLQRRQYVKAGMLQ